jgi:thioesterase domain-containing protein
LEITNSRVRISGDFLENTNHHNTVFGGSISVILLLSGWSMVREIMMKEDPSASIVVAKKCVEYLKPVKNDFEAVSHVPELIHLNRFIKSYRTYGKGKLEISADLFENESKKIMAHFKGIFYVKRSKGSLEK